MIKENPYSYLIIVVRAKGGPIMRILFWDIDGTLLKTGKAGLYAFEQVIQEVLNYPVDFSTIKVAGMTDYYIAHQAMQFATGREPTHQELCHLLHRYEEILPSHLAARQGFLTPSVQEILTYLHNQRDYASLLLTGNTSIGAKAKLTHYKLDGFFDFTASAFCDSCFNRTDISSQALAIVKERYPSIPLDHIYVIGDTPNDIHCGKAIGVRTIAVATGSFSVEELEVFSPWWAIPSLPSPLEFIKKINQ